MLALNEKYLAGIISEEEILAHSPYADLAWSELAEGSSPGSDFLGWLNLPQNFDPALLREIKEAAERIKKQSEVLVNIGIGGSYLGAKAVYEALKDPFKARQDDGVELLFAGQNLSGKYLESLIEYLRDKDFSLNVISKSGTTTEPAIAFRILRALLVEKYGEDALRERIICTTDKSRGALKAYADNLDLTCFVVPDDVGGRYSVLTPVGLLPLAAAGFDIQKLLEGAHKALLNLQGTKLKSNPAYRYAVIRNCLYKRGYVAESLVTFEPELSFFAEWWKQLFGESEGKDGKALLPTSMQFTRDLHSLGQFVQEGRKCLFETCLVIDEQQQLALIPESEDDGDGLNYLAGRALPEVNAIARRATLMAHREGAVPVLEISLKRLDEEHLGYLIYFFELACAMSARLLGVNPFDQPGVEAYKLNMFALLGKPGYEERRAELNREAADQS
ncbi:MAG: glucose-6-phosphate isomerase [Eubacteriales bacterium]|nr:glucose-6-phosphate isomerase [Eubacteriales bacterium]